MRAAAEVNAAVEDVSTRTDGNRGFGEHGETSWGSLSLTPTYSQRQWVDCGERREAQRIDIEGEVQPGERPRLLPLALFLTLSVHSVFSVVID